jgi:hypothetical protein
MLQQMPANLSAYRLIIEIFFIVQIQFGGRHFFFNRLRQKKEFQMQVFTLFH